MASPAATELESIVTDWLARAFDMLEATSWGSTGGGVLQPTASEATVLALLATESRALGKFATSEETAIEQARLPP
ncbi:Pyridoxal-dependent decarboxylase conserved domain containing protein, putative [Leishmania donovani]|uniref:Pyridoxal-dependent decarboxylase conserved domain containing protein, putative n=1 Tax=Leishmania donovani TaxID=5661 RepID=A0A3Q8II30_LEIDO|nr:Pyridoxal-dependent decarboxylase conserved domain containing protein, putative [Leishmania donovani]